jgi:hypothetical protein
VKLFGRLAVRRGNSTRPYTECRDVGVGDRSNEAKAKSHIHRETTVPAPVLDSTRHFTSNGSIGVIAFHEKAGQAYALAR